MIVTRREAHRIARGKKQQHRIRWDQATPRVGKLLPITFRRPNPDLGYQPDGSPRLEPILACRVRIVHVRSQQLQHASERDAQAEGYRSTYELAEAWGHPQEPVQTQIIEFEVDHSERPRYLSLGVIAGRTGDYVEHTARALPHEGEAVPGDYQDELVKAASKRDVWRELDRRAARRALAPEDELEALIAEARERHVDIRNDVRAVRRWWDNPRARDEQIDVIRRKIETPLRAVA